MPGKAMKSPKAKDFNFRPPTPPRESSFQENVKRPCPYICAPIPINVPGPDKAREVLHPRKDVFVLKVQKVTPSGDRTTKLELELVTPKTPDRRGPWRVDTRETQCEADCPCGLPCCVCPPICRKMNKKKPGK
ncbi:hypothetical protein JYU34_000692 [Plutella xylostella]|uniref:Uncharacterized protein n=1 Tax=Plutella xylostella TaxID=51655 RepID=A0ABQ7R8B0_PLUXY|nr:hypothetical protein JYU34_000692 [Plutella xylostella]